MKLKYINDIIETIESMDNSDENLRLLENATEYYCSMWEKCEGYKKALIMTLLDQYENHSDEQDPSSISQLKRILEIT